MKTAQMFPSGQEKVKETECCLEILSYTQVLLFCDTEKGSVWVKRWVWLLKLFLKLLMFSQNLIYNLIKGYTLVTKCTAATTPMRRQWTPKSVHAVCPSTLTESESCKSRCIFPVSLPKHFLPFSTDETKHDPNLWTQQSWFFS